MTWELLGTPPGAFDHPSDLPTEGWRPATVPGTVAQAVGAPLDPTVDLEAQDWWYRTTTDAGLLQFKGLATISEVWVEGQHVLSSTNMFRRHELQTDGGALVIAFRSLTAHLAGRRPRPRWKTALVREQKLRWIRTSLVGRVPGWTPELPAIGPWRAVQVVPAPALSDVVLRTQGARLTLRARAAGSSATLHVGPLAFPVSMVDGHLELDARVDLPRWMPHTHGTPHRHAVTLDLDGVRHDLGQVGFRQLAFLDGLAVNGVPIFCRGACWSALDPWAIEAPDRLRPLLERLRDAGLNMLRMGGTTVWASDELLELCDELGILVWQDVPLANMDYPLDDEAFRAELQAEVAGELARLARHPSVAMYCGGSEVAQQAAMLGFQDALHPWYSDGLDQLRDAHHPGVPTIPSTPWGGALPFSARHGVTHYFGVGAYRRPLEDARRARVRFAAECLGLCHVPSPEALIEQGSPPPHGPEWKAGVSRDRTAGWDFQDITDHYVERLFDVDAREVRATDVPRYLALCRAATGEVVLRTYAEWRRPGSPCQGALMWLLADTRPGAGCGIVDSQTRPKAALHHLARAWASQAVLITDEGLDGVDLHVLNDTGAPLEGLVELELLRHGRERTGYGEQPVSLSAHGSMTLSSDAILPAFADVTWAYRFGPPRHDVVQARLVVDGQVVHQDTLFPLGMNLPVHDAPVDADAQADGDDVLLTLSTDQFLQAVTFEAKGWQPDQDHVHLAPGRAITIRFRPTQAPSRAFKVLVRALNLRRVVTVRA